MNEYTIATNSYIQFLSSHLQFYMCDEHTYQHSCSTIHISTVVQQKYTHTGKATTHKHWGNLN